MTETRHRYLFKRLSYLSLNMKFAGFFSYHSTFGTGNGNEAGGFFPGLVCLVARWMEHFIAKPEDPQFRTLDVIHKRYTRTHIQRADRSKTQIHS
jgi:hypothetical protein